MHPGDCVLSLCRLKCVPSSCPLTLAHVIFIDFCLGRFRPHTSKRTSTIISPMSHLSRAGSAGADFTTSVRFGAAISSAPFYATTAGVAGTVALSQLSVRCASLLSSVYLCSNCVSFHKIVLFLNHMTWTLTVQPFLLSLSLSLSLFSPSFFQAFPVRGLGTSWRSVCGTS